MDYYILKAEAINKTGKTGIYSVKVHERDSESTSNDEWLLKFQMQANRSGVTIVGPMSLVDDPGRGK